MATYISGAIHFPRLSSPLPVFIMFVEMVLAAPVAVTTKNAAFPVVTNKKAYLRYHRFAFSYRPCHNGHNYGTKDAIGNIRNCSTVVEYCRSGVSSSLHGNVVTVTPVCPLPCDLVSIHFIGKTIQFVFITVVLKSPLKCYPLPH